MARPASGRSRASQPRNFVLDALEPRILLSAEPISQALSDRLTEPADDTVAGLFEALDETSSRIDQGWGPAATIREGGGAAEGFGAASHRSELTGADWTIDLGEVASERGVNSDWLLLSHQSSPGSDHETEARNLESSGVSSPQVDRSGDAGEQLDEVTGDGSIDSSNEAAIDGSGDLEDALPGVAQSSPVSENLTPFFPGVALAAIDPIHEIAIQIVGYVETHHVVTGPYSDTRIESGNQSVFESATAGSRMILDDSLARGPPGVDGSPADESREDEHGAPGSTEPTSGANSEAGFLLLQERDLQQIALAAFNLWRSLGLDAALLDRLSAIRFEISDLSGSAVGWTDGLKIVLDRSAAGRGWFVDATPFEDSEFSRRGVEGQLTAIEGGTADGRIDLLSVLIHEIGHVLGYDHEGSDGVMADVLAAGHRLSLNGQSPKIDAPVTHASNGLRTNDPAAATWWQMTDQSTPPVSGFLLVGPVLDLSAETAPLTITILANGDVTVTGSAATDGTHSGITDIIGGSKDDTFILSDGATLIPIGGGAGVDTLILRGQAASVSFLASTTSGSISVNHDGSITAHTGLERLVSELNAILAFYVGTANADRLRVSTGEKPGRMLIVNEDGLGPSVEMVLPFGLRLEGGNGDDTFAIESLDPSLFLPGASISVKGDLGTDTLVASHYSALTITNTELERNSGGFRINFTDAVERAVVSATALTYAAYTGEVTFVELAGLPPWIEQGPGTSTKERNTQTYPDSVISGAIHSIAVHPFNPSIIYAGTVAGGVWRSLDAGASWEPLTDQIVSLSIGAIAIGQLDANGAAVTASTPVRDLVIYAGTGSFSNSGHDALRGGVAVGLLRSMDGGETWAIYGAFELAGLRITAVVPTTLMVNLAPVVFIAALTKEKSNGDVERLGGVFEMSRNGSGQIVVERVSGLPNRGATSMVADPTDPNRFYVALRGAGVYRTDNGGDSWTQVNNGLTRNSDTLDNDEDGTADNGAAESAAGASRIVLSIEPGVKNPGPPNIIYAALVAKNNDRFMGAFKSIDMGANWTFIGGLSPDPTGKAAYATPTANQPQPNPGGQGFNNLSFYADAAGNVFLGGDSGNHLFWWSQATGMWNLLQGAATGGTFPHPDSRVFVATGDGSLFEGSDGGIFRLRDPTGVSTAVFTITGVNSLTVLPGSPSTITRDTGDWSTEGFAEGQTILINLGPITGSGLYKILPGFELSGRRMKVEPLAGTTVFSAGIMTSGVVTAGRFWESLNRGLRTVEINNIAYDALNNVLLAGTQDNGSLEQRNGLPPAADLDGDGVADDFAARFVWDQIITGDGNTQGVTYDTVGGGTFNRSVRFSLANSIVLNAAATKFKYSDQLAMRTFDETGTIVGGTGMNVGLRANAAGTPGSGLEAADRTFDGFIIIPFVINALQPNRVLLGFHSLYESADRLNTISATFSSPVGAYGPNDSPQPGTFFTALAYGGMEPGAGGPVEKPDVIYAAMRNKISVRTPGVAGSKFPAKFDYTTTVKGAGKIRDIVLDPDDWRIAYAVDGRKVYKTIDGGQNWFSISANLADPYPRSLAYVETSGGDVLLVGGVTGIARTFIPGTLAEWTELGTNLPNAPVSDVDFIDRFLLPGGTVAPEDILAVSTMGRGAFTLAGGDAATVLSQASRIVIHGSGSADTVVLKRNANNATLLDLLVAGTRLLTVPLSAVGKIEFNGLAGTDTLTVDSTNGPVAVQGKITFDGGADSDTLVLEGTKVHDKDTDTTGDETTISIEDTRDQRGPKEVIVHKFVETVNDNLAAASTLEKIGGWLKRFFRSLLFWLDDPGKGAETELALLGGSLPRAIGGSQADSDRQAPSDTQQPGNQAASDGAEASEGIERVISSGANGFSFDEIGGALIPTFEILEQKLEGLDGFDNVMLTTGAETRLDVRVIRDLNGSADFDVSASLFGGTIGLVGALSVSAEVDMRFAIGIDASGVFFEPLPGAPEFLIHKLNVDADARAFGRFGFLDVVAGIGPGGIVFDQGVGLRVDLNASAPDGRLRLSDLLPTAFVAALDFGFVDANPGTNDLVVVLDVEATSLLPGQTSPIDLAGAQVTLTWATLTNITGVNVDFSPGLGKDLEKFLKFGAQQVLDELTSLRDRLDAFGIDIPFVGKKLDQLIALTQAFNDKVLDRLSGPGGGGGASFPSVQNMVERMGQSLGTGPGGLGLAFNAGELTFHVMLDSTLSGEDTLDFGFDGLGDLSLSGMVDYTAGATLDFVVGIDVNAAAAGGNPADWIFLRDVLVTGTATVTGTNLTASAQAGGVGISITGGTVSANASFSFTLADPQAVPDGKITLRELVDAVTSNPASLVSGLTMSASASFSNMSLYVAGIVQLSGDFSITTSVLPSVTVTNGTTPLSLPNASLVTIGASNGAAFVGINGGTAEAFGFDVSVDSLAIAMISPADPMDTRSWTALAGTMSGASFRAPPSVPFTASASDLEVSVNTEAADGSYIDFTALPGGGLGVSTGSGTRTLSYNTSLTSFSGDIAFSVADPILISGSVSVAVTDVTGVDDPDTAGTDSDLAGELMGISISGATVFAGTGASLDAMNEVVLAADAVGLLVTGASLDLAVFTTDGVTPRTYTGLEAGLGLASLLGVPQVQLFVEDLLLKQNSTSVSDGDPLDWTQSGGLATGLATVGVTPGLTSSDLFSLGGTVGLSIADVVFATATINVVLEAATGVDDPDTMPADTSLSGELLHVSVTGATLFIGSGASIDVVTGDVTLPAVGAGVGFSASGGALDLAVLRTDETTPRTYTGFQMTLGAASLVGVPGVQAAASELRIRQNLTSVMGGTPLDWSAVPQAAPLALTSSQPFEIGGTLEFDLFGFVAGGADFIIEKRDVDVDLDAGNDEGDLADAGLLTIGLSEVSLSIGVPSAGVKLEGTGGALVLAMLSPADAADTRRWTAVTASLASAELSGVPGLTLSGSDLEVRVNRASGPAGTEPLDWTTALDLDGDENFADALVVDGHDVDFTGPFMQASGHVDFALFGFVEAEADFVVEKRDVDVDLDGAPGEPELTDAGLLTIGLSNASVRVGVPSAGVKLEGTGGALALALLTPSDEMDTRRWMALTASLESAQLSGVPGLTLSGHDLEVRVNRGTDTAALDWTSALDLDGDESFGDALTVGRTTSTSRRRCCRRRAVWTSTCSGSWRAARTSSSRSATWMWTLTAPPTSRS